MAKGISKWKNLPVFNDISPETAPRPKLKFRDVSPKTQKILKWKNIPTSSYKNRYGRTMKAVG